MKSIRAFLLALLVSAVPAFASSITVSAPYNGQTVTSPVKVTASSNVCPGNSTAAMGYSFDDSANTTIEPTSFSTFALVSNGAHVLHVKCWGNGGGADVRNINLNVVPGNAGATPAPSSQKVSQIQTFSNWIATFDPGTGSYANATGGMYFPAWPTLTNQSREFDYWYSGYGGELFYSSFADDYAATHFIYDAQVYLKNNAQTATVEMDVNQVLSNGQTVIYGFQCDGWTGTWDYTINAGTPNDYVDTWIHSSVACPNPSTWAAKWHHIQIAYHHDGSGNVTYTQIAFDGVVQDLIDASGNSAFALGWSPVLLTNFQLDGNSNSGNGSAVVDNLTLYKW